MRTMVCLDIPSEVIQPLIHGTGGPKTRRKERSSGADAPVVSKRFQNVIGMLHSQISQHRYGNIFHNPIKKSEAPDYHDIVKRPMDLKTIKSRVKDGLISNSLEFQRDIYLMFANAMMYNRPGSEIYNMAEEVRLLPVRTSIDANVSFTDDGLQCTGDQCVPTDGRVPSYVVLCREIEICIMSS